MGSQDETAQDAEKLVRDLERVRRSDPSLEERLEHYRETRRAYKTLREPAEPKRKTARKYRV